MLFSVLIGCAKPDRFLQKPDSFDRKVQASSVLFQYKSEAEKSSEKELLRLQAVLPQKPAVAYSFFLKNARSERSQEHPAELEPSGSDVRQ